MRCKRRRVERGTKLTFSKLEPRCLLATLSVTTFSDVVADDGLLSLREAITQANSNGQDDIIILQSGTYQLQIAGATEDNNLTGDLDILADGGHSLSILGAGQGQTIIDAMDLDRALNSHIRSSLSLSDLTITGGTADLDPSSLGRRGGGISALASNLELDSVTVTGNEIGGGGVGGGLYVGGGTLTISNSQFSENTALRTGDALFVRSAVADLQLLNVVDNGQSIVNDDTLFFVDSDISLIRSRIDNNTGSGAALSVTNSQLDLANVRFLENGGTFGSSAINAIDSVVSTDSIRVTLHSTGILVDGTSSQLDINNGFFFDNRIEFLGSELSVDGSQFIGQNAGIQSFSETANVEVANSQFENVFQPIDVVTDNDILVENIVASVDQALFGTQIGVRALGDNVLIQNVDLANSTFRRGIIASGDTLVQIANSRVHAAGGIEVEGETQILNTEITDNVAANGGGINWTVRENVQSLTISNSLIAGNTAEYTSQRRSGGTTTRRNGEGGAIHVYFFGGNDGNVNIISSSLINNRSTNGGVIDSDAGTILGSPVGHLNLEIHNSIVWNNFSPSEFEGDLLRGNQTLDFTHNVVSDSSDTRFDAGDENLTTNPQFVDFQGGDFRLRSTSPARDQGDASQLLVDSLDLDGDSDFSEPAPDLDLVDRTFSATDIGAYEIV